jgi:hypothetical protein
MTTRYRRSSRWLALAAGTALTVASVGALAADPAAQYPSATPPYSSVEYQPAVTPAPGYPAPAYVAPAPGQTTVVTTTTTTYPSGAQTVATTTAPAPVPVSPLSTPTYTYPIAATPPTVYQPMTPPAANPKAALREMQIAQEHAVYAVHAPTLQAAQTQMHAVINCIAGPGAPEFNPSVVNPCGGIGAGALVDANDTSRLPYAREALQHARSGLQTSDLAAVKQAAINTINALRQASM